MADADFRMQRHDRLPSIQATLGADLTGASSLKFIMRKSSVDWVPDFTGGASAKVNATATIVGTRSATANELAAGMPSTVTDVNYAWAATDTDTAGNYVAQWQAIWTAGSKPQTFPTDTYHTILIRADLDDA